MRTSIFFLVISAIFFSCEKKETDKELTYEQGYISGTIGIDFIRDVTLKSTFDLVNKHNLEIWYTNRINYISGLPADSMDYVMEVLNTKSYLNDDIQYAGTGKINVVVTLMYMDESDQDDWEITTTGLKLEEQPSAKSFYLKVPAGKEIYWMDTLNEENIVDSTFVIYIRSYYI